MEKGFTLVFDNKDVLRSICGVNDINLKQLEHLFSIPIYSRGNEILLETGDEGNIRDFKQVMEKIQERVQIGYRIDKDYINAMYVSIIEKDMKTAELLQNQAIIIPQGNMKVHPRGKNQASYMQSMLKNDIVVGIGPAGTGKTFLAVAYALGEVLNKRKRKLVLTRPVVEAGESLGFLPGDLTQKLSPYLHPLYDAMESLVSHDQILRLEENRAIEIAPLAYMRGRSLRDSCIVLDEAQNTTREQMKMFLTRLGEGSQALITGDITQIDLPKRQLSGLMDAQRVLKGIPGIQFSYFSSQDVVRHPIVGKIIQAYEAEES